MLKTFIKLWNFSKRRRKTIAKTLIFSFLRSVPAIAQLAAVVLVIQTLKGNVSVISGIIGSVVLAAACIIGTFFASYNELISVMESGFFMVSDKRIEIGNLLRKVPLGFFRDKPAGQTGAILTTIMSEIEASAPLALSQIAGGLLGSVAILIGLLIYDRPTGILTAVGMICYLIIVSLMMKVSRRDAPELKESQNTLSAAALSFFQGIKVIKSFSFRCGDETLKDAVNKNCKESIALTAGTMPLQYVAQICIGVFETLIVLLAAIMYFNFNIITADKAIVLIIISFTVFSSLNQAGSSLSMIGLLDSGLSEVELLESAKELEILTPKERIASDEIKFENVSFSYGNNAVLHNISTTIKPQSLTAVIGPSGSGKTTLCQLIPRFWDVSSGTIRVGGADIRHVDTTELMGKISMVFQRVYLFEDTILNNIRFGNPDASLEEVRNAAKAARCDGFIMSLPNGYDTVITEGGSRLSGGERQRISIARAILKNAPIIIMDEATSALDSENEQAILDAIDELTKNKTVIMIAHRMKTVQRADHIIAIENGRIVQEGTHEQLVSEDGLYKRFLNDRMKAEDWQIRPFSADA